MMDAMGTIIGLRKNVRNSLLSGMRASSISASPNDSTTASGTERPVNVNVFLTAILNAPFCQTLM